MSAPDRRPRFRAAVYRGRPGLHATTKVLLLRLADDMNYKGIVSVPRTRLAADLGVPTARITEGVRNARECGYLDIVRRARPMVTAVYQATIPAVSEVRPPVPHRGTDSVPPGGTDMPTPSSTTEREPERSPSVDPCDGKRSEEKAEHRPAAFDLPACGVHGRHGCPESCLDDYDREVS